MPKKGKLLAALDAAKGVDYEKKRQKSLQKRAAKLHAAKLAGSTSEALQLPAVPGDGVEVHPSKDVGNFVLLLNLQLGP